MNGTAILIASVFCILVFIGLTGSLTNDATTFEYSSYSNDTNYTNTTGGIDNLPDNQNIGSWISFLWNFGALFPSIPFLQFLIQAFYIVFALTLIIVLVRGVGG